MNNYIHSLRPVTPRPVTGVQSYIDPALRQADFVFVRIDATRPPLSKVYSGPFKVVFRADKYFTILQNGVFNNVSIDRLKTAHLPLFRELDDSFRPSHSAPRIEDHNTSEELPFPDSLISEVIRLFLTLMPYISVSTMAQ